MPSNTYEAEAARDARRAARDARRAAWSPTVEVAVTAADLLPGDFLVRIPSQANVRGLAANTTVASVEPDHTWRLGRFPVDAVLIRFRLNGAAVSVPAAFRVTVRRAA